MKAVIGPMNAIACAGIPYELGYYELRTVINYSSDRVYFEYIVCIYVFLSLCLRYP